MKLNKLFNQCYFLLFYLPQDNQLQTLCNSKYYWHKNIISVCGLILYAMCVPLHRVIFLLRLQNSTLLLFESLEYLRPSRNYSSQHPRNKLSSLVFFSLQKITILADHVAKCELVGLVTLRFKIYIFFIYIFSHLAENKILTSMSN